MDFEEMVESTKRDAAQELSILLFGVSGAGKTSSIKTIPCEDAEILLVPTEEGNEVLRNREFTRIKKDIMPKPDKLKKLFNFIAKQQAEEAKYKWIVWDSLTYWANRLKAQMDADPPMNKHGDPDMLRLWGDFGKLVMETNLAFLEIPGAHRLTIAGATEDSEAYKMRFNIDGGSKDKLGFYYDEIYGIKIIQDEENNPVRQFVTNNDGYFECKSRMSGGSDSPLDLYEPADFSTLIAKCYG